MAVKQFSVTPDLVLKIGSKKYVVSPPSRDLGLVMQAINVAGLAAGMSMGKACVTCGRSEPIDVDPKFESLVEEYKDRQLGELSLGDTYRQMVDDGLDDATLSRVELYAFYYWTLGESAADSIIENVGPVGAAAPKGRKPSKSGQSSE